VTIIIQKEGFLPCPTPTSAARLEEEGCRVENGGWRIESDKWRVCIRLSIKNEGGCVLEDGLVWASTAFLIYNLYGYTVTKKF
jgi:hypothetical protein